MRVPACGVFRLAQKRAQQIETYGGILCPPEEMVPRGYRRFLRSIPALLIFVSLGGLAQQEPRTAPDSLPQDTGAAGLRQMLVRLRTTARLMQTTAHPDDEDGGMLTLESEGRVRQHCCLL